MIKKEDLADKIQRNKINAVYLANFILRCSMSDDRIISYLKKAEHETAFTLLVDSYTERLYWHIRRFVCSHEDANDILQDVFLKVWSALPTFRGESKIFTWLYKIATNEVLNFLRKNPYNRKVDGDLTDFFLERIDEDPYFNGNALQRELHKAIQRLPEKQRLVFTLRYFDEMKYEDMSDITGTSTGALKASYHHAYNKIKEELEKCLI